MARGVVGSIPGVEVGATYANRQDAMRDGMHRQHQKGIDFDGATRLSVAIALNEGYEDDIDMGSVIIYTGEGGKTAGKHTHDQVFAGGNEGLRNAHREGAPVRVLRGSKLQSEFAPSSGYRYDGLYAVVDVWREPGRSGFQVCRFLLEALDNPDGTSGSERLRAHRRRESVVTRRVRDTAMSRRIKSLHNHVCQVCGTALEVPGGRYAEGAHVVPLGLPHDGPDEMSNILCLCPNDHVRLDQGAIAIDDDLTVRCTLTGDRLGTLRLVAGHDLDSGAFRYHRERIVTVEPSSASL